MCRKLYSDIKQVLDVEMRYIISTCENHQYPTCNMFSNIIGLYVADDMWIANPNTIKDPCKYDHSFCWHNEVG